MNKNKKNNIKKQKNKVKKIGKIKIDVNEKKRLTVCISITFILLIALLLRIGYIQFIQGASLKASAVKNQLSSKTITPTRGTIYDSTGKALAISASVDTVSVNPSKLTYSDGTEVDKEFLAKSFSSIFELDYEETLSDLTTKNSTYVIAEKVENDKVTELQEWMNTNNINSGITIEEDTKRYYPYSTLASNLIGFTGTDNSGLVGLESSLDDILARNSSVKY